MTIDSEQAHKVTGRAMGLTPVIPEPPTKIAPKNLLMEN